MGASVERGVHHTIGPGPSAPEALTEAVAQVPPHLGSVPLVSPVGRSPLFVRSVCLAHSRASCPSHPRRVFMLRLCCEPSLPKCMYWWLLWSVVARPSFSFCVAM